MKKFTANMSEEEHSNLADLMLDEIKVTIKGIFKKYDADLRAMVFFSTCSAKQDGGGSGLGFINDLSDDDGLEVAEYKSLAKSCSEASEKFYNVAISKALSESVGSNLIEALKKTLAKKAK